MKSSRVIDLEHLQASALVARRLKAEAARHRPGMASNDLRLVAQVLEAVEGHLRSRERIKGVAERTAALARTLGISADALRAAAAVDLMTDLFVWAPTVGASLCFALWQTKLQYDVVADALDRRFRLDQLPTFFFSAFVVVTCWAIFWGANKLWKKTLGSSGDPIWRRQL